MINGMDQDMDQTFFLFFYFQEYDLTIICMALVEDTSMLPLFMVTHDNHI
jgi:hypothetical protein